MIRLRREYKELSKTENKTIYHNTCMFSILKSYSNMEKSTPKNIIFYTHYFTFSYI